MITRGLVRFVRRAYVGLSMFVIDEMGRLVWRYIVVLFVGVYHFAVFASIGVLIRSMVFGSPLPNVGRYHSVALLLFSFAVTLMILKKLDIRENEIIQILKVASLKYAYRCYTIAYFVGIVVCFAIVTSITLFLLGKL